MFPAILKVTATQEDEVSNGNTEDSLISSRTSTETVNSENKRNVRCCSDKADGKCRQTTILAAGVLMIAWGIGNIIYPPYNLLLDQRIHMTPGLPAFDWWLDLSDEVLLKVYIFNITNSEEFLSGKHSKLKVAEIGPLIYREKLHHFNPIFNENGTFTYTANRSAIFLPDMNNINLNDTIVMPNLGVLFIPAYFYDAPFFTKLAINLMMRSLKSSPFITTTIQNYLWNCTDPILEVSQNIAPYLVPTKNVGILDRIYSNFEDNVTVYIGPTYGHERFFLIDKFDGSEYLPNQINKCSDKVVNSSEGVSYPQNLVRNGTLAYWRKTLCKVGYLHYTRDVKRLSMTAYEYVLSPKTYDRTFPEDQDCYKGEPVFPNGLADVSTCYFDTSIAASFPHYLYGDDVIKQYVDGLSPDVDKHGSFVIVEPNTGVPLHGIARSQVNLVMKKMRGFNEKIQRFSDMSIPLVWLEYNQVGIPWKVQLLTYFTVVLLPVLQVLFTIFLFLLGTFFLYYHQRRKRQLHNNLLRNKKREFETEVFLKM